MNILPKKSWHVRTKRNIDRVRKDEARAAQEEKELQRKIQLAVSSTATNFFFPLFCPAVFSEVFLDTVKVNFLVEDCLWNPGRYGFHLVLTSQVEAMYNIRAREAIHFHVASHTEHHCMYYVTFQEAFFMESVLFPSPILFVLFLVHQRNLHSKNEDREKEKKAEQEDYEKKIGLLTYLGQSSSEASGSKPWFAESHEDRLQLHEKSEKETRDAKNKDRIDPLHLMKHYVSLKYDLKENGQKIKKLNQIAQKTELHSKKVKRLDKPLEQLRAERLAREKAERAKAEELLRRARGELPVQDKLHDVIMDDRRRGYNSQYNPHLAKRPQ
nr:leukocyte receptor cluster member 1 homolog [Rhipicephalus microplus]